MAIETWVGDGVDRGSLVVSMELPPSVARGIRKEARLLGVELGSVCASAIVEYLLRAETSDRTTTAREKPYANVAEFVATECDHDDTLWVYTSELYSAYLAWATAHDFAPEPSLACFGIALNRAGYKSARKHGRSYRAGIRPKGVEPLAPKPESTRKVIERVQMFVCDGVWYCPKHAPVLHAKERNVRRSHAKCTTCDRAFLDAALIGDALLKAFGKRALSPDAERRIAKNALRKLAKEPICGALSHDDWSNEDDPPVTCSNQKDHLDDHAGGARGGTVTWPRAETG